MKLHTIVVAIVALALSACSVNVNNSGRLNARQMITSDEVATATKMCADHNGLFMLGRSDVTTSLEHGAVVQVHLTTAVLCRDNARLSFITVRKQSDGTLPNYVRDDSLL